MASLHLLSTAPASLSFSFLISLFLVVIRLSCFLHKYTTTTVYRGECRDTRIQDARPSVMQFPGRLDDMRIDNTAQWSSSSGSGRNINNYAALGEELKTKAQSAAATVLMMLLDCLGVPSALRPAQHYTLPLIGSIAFSWSPTTTLHSVKNCWWRLAAGSHAASPAVGGASEPQAVTFDAPLAKACVSLTALIDQSPSVNHATSLVKLYDRVVSAGGLESQAAAACIMQSLLSCCDFAGSSGNRESPAASPAHSSKTNKAAPSPQGAEAAGDSKTAARDQRTASDMAVIIKARQLLCTRGNTARGAVQVADVFANTSLENPTLLEVSQWILKHLV